MQTYNLGTFTYVIIISQKNKQQNICFCYKPAGGGGGGDKELHIKSQTHDLNQSNWSARNAEIYHGLICLVGKNRWFVVSEEIGCDWRFYGEDCECLVLIFVAILFWSDKLK